MNLLLINADDFGLHPLINEAISGCVEHGTVNSVSVMTNAGFVDYRLLKKIQQNQSFVGVHLSWLRSKWITADYEIFSWRDYGWKLLTGGKKFQDKLKKEAEAQIELMIANGIHPDHLDSHQHVHHFPPVWRIVEELCDKYGINRIRCCNAKNKSLQRNRIAGKALQRIAEARFNCNRHFFTTGIKFAGNYNLERIKSELAASTGANTELIVHPGLETDSLEKIYPDWCFDWRKEYDALMDDRLYQIISSNGFYLSKRTASTLS